MNRDRKECPFPGCTFSTKHQSSLTRHKKTVHLNEKPYKCDVKGCEYSSNQKSNLTRHGLSHSNKKPYKCDVGECKASFKTKRNLQRHKKKTVHSNERPYKCEVFNCNATYKSKYELTAHKRRKAQENIEHPSHFLCPITLNLMEDPVVGSDGKTYERETITRYLRDFNGKSPHTREKMTVRRLRPLIDLRSAIQDYKRTLHTFE